MLVLSVKLGERVRLLTADGEVWIKVIGKEYRKDWSVRLGVEAPQSVVIHREELIQEKERGRPRDQRD